MDVLFRFIINDKSNTHIEVYHQLQHEFMPHIIYIFWSEEYSKGQVIQFKVPLKTMLLSL